MQKRNSYIAISIIAIVFGVLLFSNIRPMFYNDAGIKALRNGEYEKAISYFNKALMAKPDFAIAYYNIAIVFTKIDRREDAIDALGKSIELFPEFNSAHYELGQIYLADNQLDEALKEFKICESIESAEDPELTKLIKEIEFKLQNNVSK